MSRPLHHNDTALNAFLDGSLDDTQTDQLVAALQNDTELQNRLSQLTTVREMVRHAYRTPPLPPPRSQYRSRGRAGIAAMLLIGGVCAGWFARDLGPWQPSGLIEVARLVHVPQATNDQVNVMLHVSTSDRDKMRAVLDETERLLSHYEAQPQKVNVEILANGGGLDMLRSDRSPFAGRIRDIQQRYDNVRFVACKNALTRLRQELGFDVPLIPESGLTPSALEEIVRRQRDGWVYVQI